MDQYASRKFILTIIGMVLASVAFFLAKIQPQEWLIFLGSCIFGYGVANVFDAWMTILKGKTPEVKQ